MNTTIQLVVAFLLVPEHAVRHCLMESDVNQMIEVMITRMCFDNIAVER